MYCSSRTRALSRWRIVGMEMSERTMTGKSSQTSHEPIVLCDHCQHAFCPSDTRPPASFAEQCRGFYTPSSRQREEILRKKSRLEGVADDYDRELTRLRDIVTQLESGRAQVQTHIDDYASLASAPIRRLRNPLSQPNNYQPFFSSLAQHDPDKILKRIFTFACYRGEDDAFDSHLHWLTPLVISHVCSHWRKVSLDMPEMWSYLDVTWDLNPKSNLELLRMYIARTKMDTPLSVRINSDMELFNLHYRAFSLVLEHAKRWREAIIIVDHQLLWQFLPDSFDILEKLVLRILNI
ncbi:uncharacterized protein EV420DRAFT_236598 [Desarmillaria tabescens]|uniref:F-box domain-containing protein n=1 Tax=Armillaria tabescens TaxID=1929756 RepID=A0AA39MJZ1_ARMTA|nr:uncharacterized protein EV420DRAFT_236598 [Desarmillaria tabescens]KAK0436489.1 hypothetical protein EV420DRAFT_236598 [Desarmillaria tabescens]